MPIISSEEGEKEGIMQVSRLMLVSAMHAKGKNIYFDRPRKVEGRG